MVQLGGFEIELENKAFPKSKKHTEKPLVNTGFNIFNKDLPSVMGSEVTLVNNKIKDITKAFMFSEKGGILLKGTTKKLLVKKKGDSLIFLLH